MKLTALLLILFITSVESFSQGITLLYKGGGNGGWNDTANWIQINQPAGGAPIQRVPTEFDHVIFSKSMSGLSSAGIGVEQLSDTITVGVNRTTGIRCRSMRISNIQFGVAARNGMENYPLVLVSTTNGGHVIIDSNAVIEPAYFHLQGGNPSVYDLQIANSSYGAIKAHNRDMGSIIIGREGRLKMSNSTYGSFFFGNNDSGGELYAENCNFNVNSFRLGAASKTTILDCSITDHGSSSGSLLFGIGPDSDFTSREIEIKAFSYLQFYTSGVVFNGNITTTTPQSGMRLLQADPANPLPSIINGNLKIFGQGIDLSGGLKLSGDLINYAHELDMSDTSNISFQGQQIFKIGGIANYGNKTNLDDCTKPGCHFSLEFFGDKDSKFVWPIGMPIDTLIIKKTNCAKVIFENSLYVSGETRIESGQLRLDPNPGIPYKFVCAGDVNIAKGGGLFLRRSSDGTVANIAIGGVLNDANTAADSTCAGFANPYDGVVGFYSGIQPSSELKPLAIRSNTTISNLVLHGELGTNFFLEKNLTVKELRFSGHASLLLGDFSLTVTDSLLNFSPARYIVTNGTGSLRRSNIGNKETIFPVGTSLTSYNPATLTNTGAADQIRVRVQPSVFTAGTSGTAVADKAVNRTWLVEEDVPGGSNVTLTVQWNAADELPGFSRTAAILSHFT
ncbi:MAG: hypothetical protein EOO14_08920, partial [Chitinophagaceae bacterium]